MALDRQSIEKRDFPFSRRGYDPAAVDAHLAQLAAEVKELGDSATPAVPAVSISAAGEVRAVIDAAHEQAAELIRQAATEAHGIRTSAAIESEAARQAAADVSRAAHERVSEQARGQLEHVSATVAAMLQRVNAIDTELSALLDGLRTGANRVNADLQLLEGRVADVRERLTSEAVAEGVVPTSPATENVAASEPQARPVDRQAARLAALNMALNGTPREQAESYLAANFQLSDSRMLLDEVYKVTRG